MKYKVLLVDDHKIFRNGIKLMLSKFNNIELIGEANNGSEYLELLKTKKPDIVFMDISMPIMDGIEATQISNDKYPDIKIVALTTYSNDENITKMIEAGATGYVLKNAEIDDFVKCVESVMQGRNFFSNEVLVSLQVNAFAKTNKICAYNSFTNREIQVLQLLCLGNTPQEISDELNISLRTVERHKSNMFVKTNTKNTLNLVVFAYRNKLVEDIVQ